MSQTPTVAECDALTSGTLGWFAEYGRRLKWRIDLLGAKFRGRFPHCSWACTAGLLAPKSVVSNPVHVVVERRDTGDGQVLWRTPLGLLWGVEDSLSALDYIVTEQLLGIYQQGPVQVRPGDIVLDIGGHLGTFTQVALNYGAEVVVAFEPEATNIVSFRKTFATEIETGRVILVTKAAWSEEGTLQFTSGGSTFRTTEHNPSGDGIVIEATTIDFVVDDLGLDRVDFVKMDIEGAERFALAGARRTLANHSPRLALCVYHLPDDPDVIMRIVRGAHLSYRVHRSLNHAGQLYFF